MQKKDIFALVANGGENFVNEFDESRAGLQEGKTYVVHILGGAKEKFNNTRNIVIAASEKKAGFDIETADFFDTTVGNNAFVSAGLRSAEDKKAAAESENTFFELSWDYETDKRGNKVYTKPRSGGEEYVRKIYSCNKFVG